MRKLLALIEKRAAGPSVRFGKGADNEQKLRALERSILEGRGEDGVKGNGGRGREEEVILKATNRAIEKALGLAVFFQGQGDLRVRLRTGTVRAVDDLEVGGEEVKEGKGRGREQGKGKGKRRRKKGEEKRGDGKGGREEEGVENKRGEMDKGEDVEEAVDGEDGGVKIDEVRDVEMKDQESKEEEEVPETRIRKVSVLEVAITLK